MLLSTETQLPVRADLSDFRNAAFEITCVFYCVPWNVYLLYLLFSFLLVSGELQSVRFKYRACHCFIPPRVHLVHYCFFTLNPLQEAFPCPRGVRESQELSKASPVIDLQGFRVLIQNPLFWFENISDSFQEIIKSQFVVQQLTFGSWRIFMWHFNGALHIDCNLLDPLCCWVLKM